MGSPLPPLLRPQLCPMISIVVVVVEIPLLVRSLFAARPCVREHLAHSLILFLLLQERDASTTPLYYYYTTAAASAADITSSRSCARSPAHTIAHSRGGQSAGGCCYFS